MMKVIGVVFIFMGYVSRCCTSVSDDENNDDENDLDHDCGIRDDYGNDLVENWGDV